MPCVLLTSSGAFEYFNIPLSRTKKRCKNQTTPSYCTLNYIRHSQAWVNVAWHLVNNVFIILIYKLCTVNLLGFFYTQCGRAEIFSPWFFLTGVAMRGGGCESRDL